jgi:hypothetical protein
MSKSRKDIANAMVRRKPYLCSPCVTNVRRDFGKYELSKSKMLAKVSIILCKIINKVTAQK